MSLLVVLLWLAAAGTPSASAAAGEAQVLHAQAGAASSSRSCLPANPCSLGRALKAAESDDTVRLRGGTYRLREPLKLSRPVTLEGSVQGVPTLLRSNGAAPTLAVDDREARVQDMRLRNSGSGAALRVEGGLAQRTNATGSLRACAIGNGAILRDSFCRAVGEEGIAASLETVDADVSAVAVNVTASAPRGFAFGSVSSGGGDAFLRVLNSIGDGGPEARAEYGTPGSARLEYATSIFFDSDGYSPISGGNGGDSSITGTPYCCYTPRFKNVAAGDYHQLPHSGTINHGTLYPQSGPRDADGESRIEDGYIDIGADELNGLRPLTSTRHYRRETETPRRFARVLVKLTAFSAEFPDASSPNDFRYEYREFGERGWRTCAPRCYVRLRAGRGTGIEHTVAFRATDIDGDVDRTPFFAPLRVVRTAR